MPSMTLDTADAAELAEMLSFLGHWLASDPGRLGASLNTFVGNPAYGIQQLRDDIDRFVFLLGGSDGEELFSGDDNEPPGLRRPMTTGHLSKPPGPTVALPS